MKPTLLRNATGGHKHAYHPDELAADLKEGWQIVEEEKQEEPKRKPGRPRKEAE